MIKIGVLGTANIAKHILIPTLKNLPEYYEMVALGSRNKMAATTYAESLGIPFVGDYESVINESDIQAVYLPLPNALHYEWIEKALQKGIHVLCEKSLGVHLEEVTALNRLAKEKGLALVENFQFRFHSQLNHIQQLVHSGRIGEIHCLKSYFGFPPFPDKDNIRYQQSLGGGALLDAGAYPIKIAQIFLGENLKVESAVLNYPDNRQVDISGGGFLKCLSTKQFAFVAFGFDNFYQCSIELWGSKGKIVTNRIFTAKPEYTPEVTIETASGVEKILLPPDNAYKNMLMHFYDLVITGKGKEQEYRQNISQAKLIQEFYHQANEQ